MGRRRRRKLDKAKGIVMEWNSRIWPALLIACSALAGQEAGACCREGPVQAKDTVQRERSDLYQVWFNGHETAQVLVAGDGASDLDLYVYDENDNLICRDDDGTDRMLCTWTPRHTGMFTVEIRNLGDANAYDLITN
jgi:hypothetical protein